jgi:signal transduction histidine kinase
VDGVRWRSPAFDAGVGALVAVLVFAERPVRPVIAVIGLAMAVVLLVRRRFPVTVFVATGALALLPLALHDSVRLFDAGVLIAMYAVVTYRPGQRDGILAGIAGVAGVVVAAVHESRGPANFGTIAAIIGSVTVAVWVTAYGVRTRRLYVATLEERAATLERERDHLARLAAAGERAAIARELHDVVAHSLSVMIVQADGAGFALDAAPDRARAALDTIAATGREALTDMRRVVTVLRDGTAPPEDRRPGLEASIDRARAAGLTVTVETTGDPDALGAAQRLALDRIVQEALTNTLRHAGPGATAVVRLHYGPGPVAAEISDDGRPAPVGAQNGGHGLLGMRERAALHGGTVAAGPAPGGGWQVTATLGATGTAGERR